MRGRAQLTHGEVICRARRQPPRRPAPALRRPGWADRAGRAAAAGHAGGAPQRRSPRARARRAGGRGRAEVKGALVPARARALRLRARTAALGLHLGRRSCGSHAGSALVRFGHSSDKRAHLRQVKLGQAVSEQGVALYHRTEPGARNETGCRLEAMEALKRGARARPDFLLCGDTALVSERNLRRADRGRHLVPRAAAGLLGLPRALPRRALARGARADRLRLAPASARLPAERAHPLPGRRARLAARARVRTSRSCCGRCSCTPPRSRPPAARAARAALERAEQELAPRAARPRRAPLPRPRRRRAQARPDPRRAPPGASSRYRGGRARRGKPTLRFWRDDDAIADGRAPRRDLLPDHQPQPRGRRPGRAARLVQGARARRARPPHAQGAASRAAAVRSKRRADRRAASPSAASP